MRLIERQSDVAHGIKALIAVDGRFEGVFARTGIPPLRRNPPGLDSLLYIITEQMISLTAAKAIWRRTQQAIHPVTADSVLAAGEQALCAAGQSRAKAAAMTTCARTIVDGRLDLAGLATLDDDTALKQLTSIKGIGPWTAEIYLLACLGRPDIWPAGDVALRTAAQRAFGLPHRPDRRAMIALAEPWRPWRAIAARLLWSYYKTMGR